MSKLTFSRNANGSFDFTEGRVARLTRELRQRVGEQGPRVPVAMYSAACTELVRAAHEVADRRQIEFFDSMKRIVRERPELFWLTRGVTVLDNDPTADVEVAS